MQENSRRHPNHQPSRLVFRQPHSLRPHPINARVYGDSPDPDFVDSVRRLGVNEPILITEDDLIISGHRRCQAAVMAGLDEVPAIVSQATDDDDIILLLIHCNKQRPKTKEQIGREVVLLKEVEERRAKRRQEVHGNTAPGKQKTLQEPVTEVIVVGQARDIVGKKVGMSGPQVDKIIDVVKRIDELEASGEGEQADEVRQVLNTRGVKPAHRLISPPSEKKAQAQPDIPISQHDPEDEPATHNNPDQPAQDADHDAPARPIQLDASEGDHPVTITSAACDLVVNLARAVEDLEQLRDLVGVCEGSLAQLHGILKRKESTR